MMSVDKNDYTDFVLKFNTLLNEEELQNIFFNEATCDAAKADQLAKSAVKEQNKPTPFVIPRGKIYDPLEEIKDDFKPIITEPDTPKQDTPKPGPKLNSEQKEIAKLKKEISETNKEQIAIQNQIDQLKQVARIILQQQNEMIELLKQFN